MPDEEYTEPLTEDDIMAKVKKFRTDGISATPNKYDRMRKSEDFAIGINQWDPTIAEANRTKGKFSLTIPIIGPQVNSVSGGHIQNSQDFKVAPLRDGKRTIAQLLTSLVKHATDSEHYNFQEYQQFKSGVSSGEGDMLFGLDWSRDPKHADLHIEKLNEHQVMWDPSCIVYDPNHRKAGAKFVIWEPWVDKDLINAEYPEKKEELAAQGGGARKGGLVMGAIGTIIKHMVGATRAKMMTSFGSHEREDIEIVDKYRYMITHTWWRWPKRCVLFYDLEASELDAKLLIKSEDIKEAREISKVSRRFDAQDVIRNIMHHTRSCGDIFLEDKIDELNGCQMYPISRYHPYFDNGYASGISEKLIGTQEMINYSHSAQLNILKQMPNSGWIIGGDPSGEYTRELEDHSGEDGIVLDREKAGGFVEKIKANDLPVGFNVVTEQGIEHAKMITGIRMEDPTTAKDRVATTVALKQQASAKDQAVIHENWNYTQSISGNLLIEILRYNEIYSEDEIREIVDKDDLISREYMNDARQIAVQLLEGQGVRIPEQAPKPDIDNIQNVAPEVQQATIDQYEEDVALMQQIAQQIDQIAIPIAEQMMLDDIKQMRKGRYNSKVTLSPSTETAKLARQIEIEGVNKMLVENQQLPIGRKYLLKNTNLVDKEEIIAEGEQQMAAMAQAR